MRSPTQSTSTSSRMWGATVAADVKTSLWGGRWFPGARWRAGRRRGARDAGNPRRNSCRQIPQLLSQGVEIGKTDGGEVRPLAEGLVHGLVDLRFEIRGLEERRDPCAEAGLLEGEDESRHRREEDQSSVDRFG